MHKLLRAGFRRLLRNRLYHMGLLFSAGISAAAPISRYLDIKKYPDMYAALGPEYQSAESFAFALPTYVMFALAVAAVMFLGTEYSDGTIRNKVIAGHKRVCIYISNYLVCAAAGISMLLVSYLVTFGIGKNILPDAYMTLGEILQNGLCECMTMLGFTAVLVWTAMMIQSKAGAAVAALLLTMMMFIFAMTISNALLQPEYREQQVVSPLEDEEGALHYEVDIRSEKNPRYLYGTKRAVYEQLDQILPLNQIMRVSDGRAAGSLGIMELYAVLTVLVLNGIGIVFFREKDLK